MKCTTTTTTTTNLLLLYMRRDRACYLVQLKQQGSRSLPIPMRWGGRMDSRYLGVCGRTTKYTLRWQKPKPNLDDGYLEGVKDGLGAI